MYVVDGWTDVTRVLLIEKKGREKGVRTHKEGF